jgi:type IV pilus assembly protein PilE
MKTLRSQRGFSLIELMIVVLVLGILAAIAYPSYTESVRKARRAQAAADITELAQNLERWHTVNANYSTYVIPARLQRSPQQGAVFYNIAAVRAQNTFTITATPANDQVGDRCGNFTLNQAGTKGVSAASVPECW